MASQAETPPFSSLPLKKDGPRGNAWGLYGPTDELGMLNRLTTQTTIAASKEIVHGVRVCTDWALDQPKVPGFGRAKFEHEIKNKEPRTVNDDEVKFNTQSSTQWDGFRHFGKWRRVEIERKGTDENRVPGPQSFFQRVQAGGY
jgi:hypothetical protein